MKTDARSIIDRLMAMPRLRYDRERLDHHLLRTGFVFTRPVIHLTGTNGKGSTANWLYGIYRAAGLKVALFHSPYLTDINEMMLIDDRTISDEEFLAIHAQKAEAFTADDLSEFEIETIIALTWFEKEKVDLVILECGMGGLLDATNIVTPILSIITNVSLEHTAWLGRSISEIARNKAGIIKHDVPVLIGRLEESADYAIRERVRLVKTTLHRVDDFHDETLKDDGLVFSYHPYHDLHLHTKAFYQLGNAALAIEAVKILQADLPVKEDALREGLLRATLPGRYERLRPWLIIDGAHNPAGSLALRETLEKAVKEPYHILFAAFKDKNIDLMLSLLQRDSVSLTLTTFAHPRARTADDYFLYLADYPFVDDYLTFIREFPKAHPDEVLVVTGSLAFVGLVRRQLEG